VLPPGLPTLREALLFLHQPPPRCVAGHLEDHSHPAWQRLKFEELLAQQLSQLPRPRRERALLAARRRLVPPARWPAGAAARCILPLR
jgi:ATP-dependent DNA helicase RecG